MANSADNFHESYLINLFKMMRYGGYNEKVLTKKRNEICRINQICEDLFAKDYVVQLINNLSEVLCPHYPPKIIIPYDREEEQRERRNEQNSMAVTNGLIVQAINKSINARCRNRFAVPALSFKNRFLCRSSTLSGTFELYGRQYFSSVFGSGSSQQELSSSSSSANANSSSLTLSSSTGTETDTGTTFSVVTGNINHGANSFVRSTGKEAFDQIRGDDKILLETLKIRYIFDLMLENKKMMFGLPVSSSEKIDRHNRYREFNIISLPYPGCEFFNEWRSSNYKMNGLFFDWDNTEINSELQIQISFTPAMSNSVKWTEYRNWDLTTLTSNYLKLILGIMVEDVASVLIHCISGWDRTPLFASLVRCLLWADGLAHQSLSAPELLYLTLAYDWYLFGHQTKTRLEAGEEILKFTFAYLQHVARDLSTSISYVYDEFIYALVDVEKGDGWSHKEYLKEKLSQRTEKLEALSFNFHLLYDQELSLMVNRSSKKGAKSFIYSASSLVNNLFSNSDSSKSSSSKKTN